MPKYRRTQRVSEEISPYGDNLPLEGSRTIRVSVTVDSGLLSFIDDYVERNERTNRSAVFDQALEMWVLAQQRRNDENYYSTVNKETKKEQSDWRKVSDDSVKRIWS